MLKDAASGRPHVAGSDAARLRRWSPTRSAELLRARPGEERAVGFAFALLLHADVLLLPAAAAARRDGERSGLENLPSLYAGTLAAMLLLTPRFGALVSRVRKPLLLPIAYAFFASNLLVFYLLFKLDAGLARSGGFVLRLGIRLNMFVVSVFWSFMADVFRDEEAKRLFGPIAAGGGTGAIVGPLVLQYLAPRIGVDAVVFLSMLLLLGTLPCIRGLARWAEARHGRFVLPPDDPEARIGGAHLSGLLLVARSPYLLGIVAIIAIGSIAAAFMYNEFLRVVEVELSGPRKPRSSSSAASISSSTSRPGCSRAFVVGWLIRRFELAGALVAMPIVALVSFLALAAAPILLVLAAGQVLAASRRVRHCQAEPRSAVHGRRRGNQVQGEELHRHGAAARQRPGRRLAVRRHPRRGRRPRRQCLDLRRPDAACHRDRRSGSGGRSSAGGRALPDHGAVEARKPWKEAGMESWTGNGTRPDAAPGAGAARRASPHRWPAPG